MTSMITDWVRGLGRWSRLLLSIALGAVMTAGHAPVDLPWGFFVAVPMMVWMISAAEDWRQAAFAGWGFAFGYFVTGLHWIGHAFLVDAEAFAWLLPIGVTGLPAFLALFWAAAFGLARWLWPVGPVWQVLTLAACLTGAELLRGHVLTGFPWALPAYAWTETPLLQSASWAGPFGLSFVVLVLTALPLVALLARRWGPLAAALGGFISLWIWGDLRVPEGQTIAADAPVIRVVQPNAPQHLKWDPEHIPTFYRRLLQHSAAPAETASGRPDLILWPETAVTFAPTELPEARAQIAQAANGAPVVLGALRPVGTGAGLAYRNAIVTILPDGSLGPLYDKHHLVPFGEYMPLKEVMGALGLSQLAKHGGLTSGPGPRSLQVADLPEFAATVCYEMIFPHQIVAPGDRPDWILTVTNDAWFGGFAGPQQHLAQARFRAVEQGLPVARAANTGVSSILDSYGGVINHLNLHIDGYLDQALPPPLAPTIYSFTGNLGVILACLSVILLGFLKKLH